VVATDGCGVPTFGFPVSGLARAWATLAAAMAARDVNARLHDIGWAMARYPELTSGTGRLDLQVVRGAREPMAVKIGAQGVFCMALPARGLGLAVKVHTGVTEALPAAVAATLASAAPGAFVPPEEWDLLRVRNVVGDVVGQYRVV
jgi:L-asparaginase II